MTHVPLTILMAAGPDNWDRYRAPLETALAKAGITARLVQEAAPDAVDYIV